MCRSRWAVLALWTGDSSDYCQTTAFLIALYAESRLIQKSYHNNTTSTRCLHKYLTHPREWMQYPVGWKTFLLWRMSHWTWWYPSHNFVAGKLSTRKGFRKLIIRILLLFYLTSSYCRDCHPCAGWRVLQLSISRSGSLWNSRQRQRALWCQVLHKYRAARKKETLPSSRDKAAMTQARSGKGNKAPKVMVANGRLSVWICAFWRKRCIYQK